ncbi:MAG: hypothetical protein Q8O63_07830 [Hoeflea sp.]|nr:hypothetical protein [Hoeflea sp.]
MKSIARLILLLVLIAPKPAFAGELIDHYFGSDPQCSIAAQPVLLVTDLTVTGEIDDSISMHVYRQLELRGCIKVIGVVSIFGNGKSTTAEIHRNMGRRLPDLGCADWRRLRGPDERLTTVLNKRGETQADIGRLQTIAGLVRNATGPVVIAELGPVTVSARLLAGGYLDRSDVKMILGVGGRMDNESFATHRGLGRFFAFRDMNVAEDVWGQDYLIRTHPDRVWMVTYRTGIANREVSERQVTKSIPALAAHARSRAKVLRLIGFEGIPTWDTWTTGFFLRGGNGKLGCRPLRARMAATTSGPNMMRLILGNGGHSIIACTDVDD